MICINQPMVSFAHGSFRICINNLLNEDVYLLYFVCTYLTHEVDS